MNIKNCKISDDDRARRVEQMRSINRPTAPIELLQAVAGLMGESLTLYAMARRLALMGFTRKSGKVYSGDYVKQTIERARSAGLI